MTDKLTTSTATRDKGARWLLDQLQPDGALGDPAEGFRFYRAPWTFTQVGATDAAAAVCGWVRREMLTPDGDFGGPYRVLRDAYAYRNATFVMGAHLAGQYDLSFSGLPLLARWQDDRSGGVSADLLPNGEMSDNLDIPYTRGVGFAFLVLGELDRARRRRLPQNHLRRPT